MKHLHAFLLPLLLSACSSRSTERVEEQETSTTIRSEEPTPLARWKDKGVDFVAQGQEPFWTVELDLDKGMHLFGPGVKFEMHTPIPEREEIPHGFRYHAEVESGKLTIEVIQQSCTDPMSGDAFPFLVRCLSNEQEFLGCGRFVADEEALSGTWQLLRLDAQAIDPEMTDINLVFDLPNARIYGNDGCNNYFGSAEISRDRLRLSSALGSTLKACEDMELGLKFSEVLSSGSLRLQAGEGKLVLESDAHRLVFSRVVEE